MSDIYTHNGKVASRCSVCGDTKKYRQTKKPQYFKPYYFPVFEKMDIFRGNDEYLGMICNFCLKSGRISEVNKNVATPTPKDSSNAGGAK